MRVLLSTIILVLYFTTSVYIVFVQENYISLKKTCFCLPAYARTLPKDKTYACIKKKKMFNRYNIKTINNEKYKNNKYKSSQI